MYGGYSTASTGRRGCHAQMHDERDATLHIQLLHFSHIRKKKVIEESSTKNIVKKKDKKCDPQHTQCQFIPRCSNRVLIDILVVATCRGNRDPYDDVSSPVPNGSRQKTGRCGVLISGLVRS